MEILFTVLIIAVITFICQLLQWFLKNYIEILTLIVLSYGNLQI